MKIPQNMKSAKIWRTWFNQGEVEAPGGAPRVLNGPISACARMAPIFPEAAEIP